MKALTFWEPWATLFAIGAKLCETRSWPIPGDLIGQPIAIHAATRWTIRTNGELPGQLATALSRPFVDALRDAWGWHPDLPILKAKEPFRPPTLGKVLAVATFSNCMETTFCDTFLKQPWQDSEEKRYRHNPALVLFIKQLPRDGTWESAFGNFGPDRFAWISESVTKLETPVKATGGQRIWNLTGEPEAQVKAQL